MRDQMCVDQVRVLDGLKANLHVIRSVLLPLPCLPVSASVCQLLQNRNTLLRLYW